MPDNADFSLSHVLRNQRECPDIADPRRPARTSGSHPLHRSKTATPAKICASREGAKRTGIALEKTRTLKGTKINPDPVSFRTTGFSRGRCNPGAN